MTAVVHAEWIKLRSVRSNIIVFVVAVLLVVAIAVIASSVSRDEPGQTIELATTGVLIANLLFGILGVQIIGQEYRFNTILPTYTAVPNRRRVLLAKLITITASTAVFSVVMLALSVLVVKVLGPSYVTLDQSAWRTLLGTIGYGVGFAAFGFAVGAIVRQPIAGIILVVLWPFAVEGIIGTLSNPVSRFLPFLQGGQMATIPPSDAVTGFEQLDPNLATIYFFAVIAVLVIIGLVLADRRDA